MTEDEKQISTDSYKGVRDFYPEDMSTLKYIFLTWRKTVESFGYVEYNASILEPSELYRAKSSDEIVNEQTYIFTDRGGREVTLRPEMTPTVARMVAGKRRELSFPLRWYSIPNLFRYERPQRGRLREHFQLNADIFGIETLEAEIEMITLAHELLKNFGLTDDQFVIKINDKAHFREALGTLGLSDDLVKQAGTLLDKRGKIETFEADWEKLTGKKFDAKVFDNPKLDTFIKMLEERGITNAIPDTTLVRGFDYYSGLVFEVFDTNLENKRSLFGGGRYDNLVSMFGEEKVPAVGFGMGDVTMRDVLETYKLLPAYVSTTDLYICVLDVSLNKEASDLAKYLRTQGLNVGIDLSGKKLGEQIKKADKDRIPYIVCVGEEELKTGKFKLKELSSGNETIVEREGIASGVIRG